MSAAFVQQAHGASSSAASVSVSYSASVGAGRFLTAQICLPAGASVAAVIPSTTDRWIQVAHSYAASVGGAEIWMCRGAQGGTTSVTVKFTNSTTADVNIAEWSGVNFVDPLDQWSANFGTSTTPAITSLNARNSGGVVIGAQSGVATSGPPSGWTALTQSGSTFTAGYELVASSGAISASWGTGTSAPWVTAAACFMPGAGAVNPNLQFPEVLVEISTTNNYQAPLNGVGVWTGISGYVETMTLGPLGRAHLLDRVQATSAQIGCNNRASGALNPWNTQSFLYSGGFGLRPMNPVKVTAAWNGITSPAFYGYLQSVEQSIENVLDVDTTLNCVDIFQMLSLKYLSNNNYAQLVMADGGADLVAYYRLGDAAGSSQAIDSSGNGYTASLDNGIEGLPAFGATGAFLYDADTALDLTNGSNSPSGGITMVDNSQQPPVVYSPLSSASAWSFECWARWTQSSPPTPPLQTGNTPSAVLLHAATATPYGNSPTEFELQVGWFQYIQADTTSNVIYVPNQLMSVYGSSASIAISSIYIPNIYDGVPHHLVYTTTDGNGFSFYVDGIAWVLNAYLSTTSVSELSFGWAQTPLTGSGSYDGTSIAAPWAGVLDEVALYSFALSSEQVANHYNTGKWFQSEEFGAINGAASVARLNKVMAVAGLDPATEMYVPYPFKTLLYAETNAVTTTSALNYIQTETESEPGLIFQGPDGSVHAYNRQYQYLNPTSTTSQGIFGDSASVSYHYDGPSLQVVQDDLDLFNDFQVESGRQGAQLQEWSPSQSSALGTSASVYGSRVLQGLTSLQFEYDADALAVAQWYAAIYADPDERVQQMTLNSFAAGGNNISQMLQRGPYDRITVQYQGQTAGPQFTQDALIESITHTITLSDPSWSTTWALSPYEILLNPLPLGVWTFGSPASEGVLTL